MTTLALDAVREILKGDFELHPVIASDIIYQGAAVGIVPASGHARPLAAGDRFAGFADYQADNSTGAAAAISVSTRVRGAVQLTVTGVTITDKGQPVYATDDDTFVLSPVGGVFIGFVAQYVTTNTAIVEFDAKAFRDPWAAYSKRETISDNKTLDIEDNGKLFWVDTDAKAVTLPAVATPVNCVIVNGGSYGTIAVSVSPNASDKVQGPDLAGTDNKDLINTKATAQRGDYVRLMTGDANGALVSELRGTWATEG